MFTKAKRATTIIYSCLSVCNALIAVIITPEDGSGGEDENIGITGTEQECANKVVKKRQSATGATFYPISKHCFAEYAVPVIEIVHVQFYARACKFQSKLQQ